MSEKGKFAVQVLGEDGWKMAFVGPLFDSVAEAARDIASLRSDNRMGWKDYRIVEVHLRPLCNEKAN